MCSSAGVEPAPVRFLVRNLDHWAIGNVVGLGLGGSSPAMTEYESHQTPSMFKSLPCSLGEVSPRATGKFLDGQPYSLRDRSLIIREAFTVS